MLYVYFSQLSAKREEGSMKSEDTLCPPLSVDNVMAVLEGVEKWGGQGQWLPLREVQDHKEKWRNGSA